MAFLRKTLLGLLRVLNNLGIEGLKIKDLVVQTSLRLKGFG